MMNGPRPNSGQQLALGATPATLATSRPKPPPPDSGKRPTASAKGECGDTNKVLGLRCNREPGHGQVHTHDDGNTARSWGFAPEPCPATDHTRCVPGLCGEAASYWAELRTTADEMTRAVKRLVGERDEALAALRDVLAELKDRTAEARGARDDYEQVKAINAELADERDRLAEALDHIGTAVMAGTGDTLRDGIRSMVRRVRPDAIRIWEDK